MASDDATNNKSTSGSASKAVELEDKEYDPTAEALIDEIDDERTLDEEEALDGQNATAVQNEIDELKNEAEMPIEELMAYYEKMRQEAPEEDSESEPCTSGEDEDEELDDSGDDSDDDAKFQLSNKRKINDNPNASSSKVAKTDQSTSKQSPHSSPNQRKDADSTGTTSLPTSTTTTTTTTTTEQTNNQQIPEASSTKAALPNHTSRLRHLMTNFVTSNGDDSGMFDSLLGFDIDDDDELDDEDYSCSSDDEDERDWRRSIQVGPDYQAVVPDNLEEYDDLPPYQNIDKIMWNSNCCPEQEEIINYLRHANQLSKPSINFSISSIPKYDQAAFNFKNSLINNSKDNSSSLSENNQFINSTFEDMYMLQSRKTKKIDSDIEDQMLNADISSIESKKQTTSKVTESKDASKELYFHDEEQLLFLLHQCNYNIDEAMRRRKLDPFKFYVYEPMSSWSQEECLAFEHGLRVHGKNFFLIGSNQVLTRSRSEIVAFYYLWKKSERHDMYTNQYKLDRKRCLTHPGTTDYMDKFIDDNEAILNESSSASLDTQSPSLPNSKQLNNSFENGCLDQACVDISTSNYHSVVDLPHQGSISRNHLQLHQQQNRNENEKNAVNGGV